MRLRFLLETMRLCLLRLRDSQKIYELLYISSVQTDKMTSDLAPLPINTLSQSDQAGTDSENLVVSGVQTDKMTTDLAPLPINTDYRRAIRPALTVRILSSVACRLIK
jgi:glycerate-2-kinase